MVDELAGTGRVHEIMGPKPYPPIGESVIKKYTKKWAAFVPDEKGHLFKHSPETKSVVRQTKGRIYINLKKHQ